MRILLELAGWRREFIIDKQQWLQKTVDLELVPPFIAMAPVREKTVGRYTPDPKYRFTYKGNDLCGMPIFICE